MPRIRNYTGHHCTHEYHQSNYSYNFRPSPILSTEQMSVSTAAIVVSSNGAGKVLPCWAVWNSKGVRPSPDRLMHHRLVTHQNLPTHVWAFCSVTYCTTPPHGVCYFFDLLYNFSPVTNVSPTTWSEYAIHLQQDAWDVTPINQREHCQMLIGYLTYQ